MTRPHIRIISFEDWEAMYVNGVKVVENHSLNASQIIEALQQAGLDLEFDYTTAGRQDEDDTQLYGAAYDTLAEYVDTL